MSEKQPFLLCAAIALLAVTGPSLVRLPASQVCADSISDSPSGADQISLNGFVESVDADRDRVAFTTEDGRHYTLDTYRSDIRLGGSSRAGETADLIPGMHVNVEGSRLSGDIIRADHVRILSANGSGPVRASRPSHPLTDNAPPDGINLRGTVEAVDQRHRSFIVRINQHTRTIYLDDSTDLTQIDQSGSDRVPVHAGDRVTVQGILRPDGTVVADTISQGQPAENFTTDGANAARTLVGRVSQPSNRYTTRDIKVRVDATREVKVHVPTGIPIRRDGKPISVHELNTDDVIRVIGIPDGDGFLADRIEVVRLYDSG